MRRLMLPMVLIAACPGGGGDSSTATTTAASTTTVGPTTAEPTTTSASAASTATSTAATTDTTDATTVDTTATTSTGDTSTGGGPTSTGDDSTTGDPATGKIQWVGRYDDSDPQRVKLGWPGSGFKLTMYGTELQVELEEEMGTNYYQVLIDGQYINDPIGTGPGKKLYPVAKNLLLGNHQIEVYRRTEGAYGVTTVTDFVVTGQITDLAPSFPHRVEVIGDGVSSGWDNDRKDLCGDPLANNYYRSYASDLTSGLSFDVHTIAWKGKGVVKNEDGSKTETLPQLYDRTLATDPANPWDYSRWPAELVAVNLGLADFSGADDPGEQEFVAGYVDFLVHVRDVNPDAFILVLMPWKFDAEAATVQAYLESVVDQRHMAGDMDVAFEDINVKQLGDGCPGYPYRDTHEDMSLKLVDAMFKHVPW